MKRPTMLAKAILQQQGLDLGLSVERDVRTLARRVEHEGLSFLTMTMPLLSDALERGLEECRFTCPSNFAKHGSLPHFLKGFFNLVFAMDGTLLPDPSAESIRAIRQICRFFKKLKIPCSESREAAAAESFLAIEGELRQRTDEVERDDNVLDQLAAILWTRVFRDFDPYGLICRHGPGVTADRYLSNERNRIKHWNERAEHSFPSDLHCYPNYGYAGEAAKEGTGCVGGIEYHSVSGEPGVRVTFVPKTQTAPRVIAIEPSHVQYMQQGLMTYVVKTLESDNLTRRSLRFSDQRPNQRLAYRSSITGRLATLDLKDASDRVHLHLVQRIFRKTTLLESLEDCRSLHATLPDGRNIVLTKFASMGSAMCFPVEAMVFYTLIQSAMHQLDGIRPSYKSISKYSTLIDIYGDDIIVPVEYTDVVVRYLESYALKVNINKSFRNSLFRESCGADFYGGVDVKPVYARQLAPDAARDWLPEHVMAWTATANQLYMSGQWAAAQAVRDMVSSVVGRPIPRSRCDGDGVFFKSLLFTTGLRYNTKLHGWRQRRTLYTPLKRKDIIDGDPIACLNRVLRPTGSVAPEGVSTASWTTPLAEWQMDACQNADPCYGGRSLEESTTRTQPELEGSHGPRDLVERSAIRLGFRVVADRSQRRSSGHDGPLGSSDVRWSILTHDIDTHSVDFMSSTYRGRYKPQYRWVMVSQP